MGAGCCWLGGILPFGAEHPFSQGHQPELPVGLHMGRRREGGALAARNVCSQLSESIVPRGQKRVHQVVARSAVAVSRSGGAPAAAGAVTRLTPQAELRRAAVTHSHRRLRTGRRLITHTAIHITLSDVRCLSSLRTGPPVCTTARRAGPGAGGQPLSQQHSGPSPVWPPRASSC